MVQTGIFNGRTRVRYGYARWGWTRGGGKTWHGGIDLEALDDTTIRMPFYKGRKISGKVTRARIVTNKNNKTWERSRGLGDVYKRQTRRGNGAITSACSWTQTRHRTP